MSGHNKWSKIKHKKGVIDVKRSKIWTKIIREIAVAAKIGGSIIDVNPRLRKAICDAKSANILKDTINKAIQKGSLSKDTVNFEELIYEGHGPNGVALLIECMTDNRNRTLSDVRSLLNKRGGKMSATGSVLYSFKKKGKFIFKKNKFPDLTDDILLEKTIKYGIEDIKTENDSLILLCEYQNFQKLQDRLFDENLVPTVSKILMIPDSLIDVSGDKAKILLKLIELLEKLDDVQNVWSNMNVVVN